MSQFLRIIAVSALATSLVGCATPGSLEEFGGVPFGATPAEVAEQRPCHLSGLRPLAGTPGIASDSCPDLPVLGSPHYALLVFDHDRLVGIMAVAVSLGEARLMQARMTEQFGERHLLESDETIAVFGREQDGIVDASMKSGSYIAWVTPSHAEFPLTLAARVFAESGLRVSAPEPAIIKTGN